MLVTVCSKRLSDNSRFSGVHISGSIEYRNKVSNVLDSPWGSDHLYTSTPVLQWLYSPLDQRFAGSITAGVDGFFSERKNPEYDFLRKGSKAVGPVS